MKNKNKEKGGQRKHGSGLTGRPIIAGGGAHSAAIPHKE